MKKSITLKSEFNRGDIVEYCKIKMKVLGHKFDIESYNVLDKKGTEKTLFIKHVTLKCKVIKGEQIPKHWNQDGTIYPLERDRDVKLIKRAK